MWRQAALFDSFTNVGVSLDQRMQGAWRGRQNASSALTVVDTFFTTVISTVLAHDVQAKDLDLPLHSARTHDLLAENTAAVNMSYTVY